VCAEARAAVTAPARLVYIAGSGRSGSTLIERALGAAPRWVNVGELIELFRKPTVAVELCGCGEPFEECQFWSTVGGVAFGGWSPSLLTRVGGLQRRLSRQRYLPRLLLSSKSGRSSFAADLRESGVAPVAATLGEPLARRPRPSWSRVLLGQDRRAPAAWGH